MSQLTGPQKAALLLVQLGTERSAPILRSMQDSEVEELMTEVMFDLPSRDDITEVKITESAVLNGTPPLLEISPKRQKKEA